MTPANIYSLLKRDEGVIDHGYFLNGIPHCGVGHNLMTGPALSPAVIDLILEDDVAYFSARCETLEGWTKLTDVRQAVLISMAFNLGFAKLTQFVKMLQAVALGDFHTAAQEIRNSEAHLQNPQRYDRLARMMESDAWA